MNTPSGSRPLASAYTVKMGPHWTPVCAIVALYHGDTVASDLQIQPLHMLRQCVDEVGIVAGYLIILVLGLSGSWIGQPAGCSSLSPPRRAFQLCSG